MPSVLTTRDRRVPDEVWESLDPEAGRLSHRTRHGLLLFEGVVLIVVAIVFAALASGVGKARLSVELTSVEVPNGSHPSPAAVQVFNHGSVTATVSKIGASPGLTIASARELPAHIKPHGSVTLTVQLTLTDCAAAVRTAPELSARVEQFWGHWSEPTETGASSLLATVVDRACTARS